MSSPSVRSSADEQQEAIAALLERSGRDHVPIRRSFLQRRDRLGGGRSVLAEFVTARRAGAFDLYLLALALASAKPYTVSLAPRVWARLTGFTGSGATARVNRSWDFLEYISLVRSEDSDGARIVHLLREDGSGLPYHHAGIPTSASTAPEGDYFKLPHAYWHARLDRRLGLAAKSVLLIALSLSDGFLLPADKASSWYGVSPDTIKRGLRDLRTIGVLSYTNRKKPTPLTPQGFTVERRYSLRGPMGSRAAAGGAPDN